MVKRRRFNTEGLCNPNKHYMVKLDERVRQIKEQYVDEGLYFVINKGRQYGKTTTLAALAQYLSTDYIVVYMDFQQLSTADFENEQAFTLAFSEVFKERFLKLKEENAENIIAPISGFTKDNDDKSMREMFKRLGCLCENSKKPVVLIIDEVDSASNNRVFVDFLAQLRKYYLDRDNTATFQSVILAGLYDIKNLKLKMRPEEEHQYNSPWNIATLFKVDMAFSTTQIAQMLQEYEADYRTGMDIDVIAQIIYDYTSGYPYLVSAICKTIDEDFTKADWCREGIEKAVHEMQMENIPLFDSMTKQLDIYKDLHEMIEDIIYQGKKIPFSLQVKSINLGVMFGFLKESDGGVAIANRIFEMVLLNMFIAAEALESPAFKYGDSNRSRFISEGWLNMNLVLEKFVEYYTEIYGENTDKFLEENGRRLFLLFLKPIINGTGNYYLEAQTRDARRTDVIVDYKGEQFIVEMKIWHGSEYNKRGEEQLTEYLDYYGLNKGYMLSFNFNKEKTVGMKEVTVGSKTIVEAVV